MSLYNMVNGVNPSTFFVLPMLDLKQEEIPRLRDCFVENGEIHVYTRVGGGNRNAGFGEEILTGHVNFISTWDDDFDSTYGYYSFSVPAKWKKDFELIQEGKIKEVSEEYKQQVIKIWPKAGPKIFDKLSNQPSGKEK